MQKINKLGVVFGTYAPMHVGHVDLITKAKRENQHVLVIVSGTNTQTDRGTQAGLPLDKRWRYAREVFNNDPLVTVSKLDEKDIPQYPNGWDQWLIKLDDTINQHFYYDHLNIYVGEQEYVAPLNTYFEKKFQKEIENVDEYSLIQKRKLDVTLVERTIIPISATQIRQNPHQYWNYITKPFKRHFTKKVLIAGSASGGKSTLTEDLARLFGADYSEEFARSYQKMYNVKDEELVDYDFVHITTGQYKQTQDIIDKANHRGLVIADTNSSVTKAYYDWYCKDSTRSDKKMMEQLYQSTVAREQWDLILFVMPQSKYVNDGVRDMSMADQNIRDKFTKHLLSLLKPFKDKIVILESENPDNFFIDNYEKAKKAIVDYTGIKI